MTTKKTKSTSLRALPVPFEAEGYLEVGVKRRGRRDCEKLYFKPIRMAVIVLKFVEFVANK
ncbi:MAG: hypothetical protein DMG10_04740 [Acidobacteria bacterium]|nr:MAG: hypothetical protein DMG10_04740 [Acidobacteriota bacterium]